LEKLEKIIDANDGYEQTSQCIGEGIESRCSLNKKEIDHHYQDKQPGRIE
jgi:hypothetical protein